MKQNIVQPATILFPALVSGFCSDARCCIQMHSGFAHRKKKSWRKDGLPGKIPWKVDRNCGAFACVNRFLSESWRKPASPVLFCGSQCCWCFPERLLNRSDSCINCLFFCCLRISSAYVCCNIDWKKDTEVANSAIVEAYPPFCGKDSANSTLSADLLFF